MNTPGRRVLVIDDDNGMLELIKLILARRDYAVILANGGLQGLALAEQDPPDLIVTAVMMPNLDGYQVYRRVRETPALQDIPVLMIDARPATNVCPIAKRLGAAGFLSEPFSPQELLAACEAALRGETYYPLPIE